MLTTRIQNCGKTRPDGLAPFCRQGLHRGRADGALRRAEGVVTRHSLLRPGYARLLIATISLEPQESADQQKDGADDGQHDVQRRPRRLHDPHQLHGEDHAGANPMTTESTGQPPVQRLWKPEKAMVSQVIVDIRNQHLAATGKLASLFAATLPSRLSRCTSTLNGMLA
jgi:hypothetical protein